jgi:hypothetical protein
MRTILNAVFVKAITFYGNVYQFYTQYFQTVTRLSKVKPLSLPVIYRQMILYRGRKISGKTTLKTERKDEVKVSNFQF